MQRLLNYIRFFRIKEEFELERRTVIVWVEEIKKDNEVIAYKFVERFKNPYTGKDQRISIRSKKNTPTIRKEMPDLLKDKFEKIVKPLPTTDSITFKKLTDIWLDFVSKTQKPSTYRASKVNSNALCKFIGTYKVSLINSIVVNQMFQSLLEQNKFSTVKLRKKNFQSSVESRLQHRASNKYKFTESNNA